MRFTLRVAEDAGAGTTEILPLQVKVIGAQGQALSVATTGTSLQILGKNAAQDWLRYQ